MIYRFKATIPGSKLFMREYEIPGDYSLFKLHTWLTSQFEFNPDQIVAFRGINATGKSKSLYGLFDMGDGSMDAVTIEQCIKKGEIFIQYIYNIQRGSVIVFSLIEEDVPLMPRCTYPRLVAEKGKDPDQFEKYVDDEQIPEPHEKKHKNFQDMDDDDLDDEPDDDFDDDERDDEERDDDDENDSYEEDELPEGEEVI